MLLGVFSGSYYIPDHVSHLYVHSKTYISGLINSPYVRVGVDVLIIMFNYWYFVILMPYFMRGRRDMDYFFNLVKNIALLFVVVGFIDYLTYSVFGFNLLTRHAYDSVYVGDRFHSFAGEPRHAVPYIVMLVFLYFLWSFVYCNKVRFIYLIVFILAAVLTKSTSGVVGAMIGVVFVVLFSREGGNKFSLSMLLFFLILMVFVFTEKINMYYSGFLELEWGSGLESAPRILHGQMRDIFPLMKILEDVYNLNLVPVLFGNGALSATFLNNIYYQSDTFSLLSPSSQIVRVLYEQGLIGFVILFMLFYLPFYRSSLVLGNGLQSSYLMVIAFYMAQRSVVVFIALGVVVAVVRIINLSIEESYLMQKETGG